MRRVVALDRVISEQLPIFCHSRYGSLRQSEFCQGPGRSARFCTGGVGMTKNRTAVCREVDWSSVFTGIILALTFLYLVS